MFEEIFYNTFKYKKGLISSNIYYDVIKNEMEDRLDAEWSDTYLGLKKILNGDVKGVDTDYDYVVLIYDSFVDTNEEQYKHLEEVLENILYEKVIVISNESICRKIRIGNSDNLFLVRSDEGFSFNDIIKGLKDIFKSD